MITELNQGHLDEASAAVEHVVSEARAAGDQRLASRSATAIAYVLLHGPTPVDEASRQCRELLETVSGNRPTQALIESTLAVLTAMAGDFDGARTLYRHSQAVLTEMGGGVDAMAASIDSARVESLAGDLAAARAELIRDHDALAAIDETFFRSTIAARLGSVMLELGDPAEALRYAKIAEEIGDADDILTQVGWREARARLAAHDGEAEAALRYATEAVELAGGTTDGLLRADALVSLGAVHTALGQRESAGPPLQEALELYERKGDRVSARALSERLAGVPAG